jgi:hypothetical protein
MIAKLGMVLVLSVLCAQYSVHAQPTGKVYRLGFLGSGSATAQASLIEALLEGLRERGWVEGRNIRIEYRFAENRFDRLPDLAADLVRLEVDLIVAVPAAAAVAARKATSTIPIVMASAAEPVALGLIASYARPGGNVTGLAGSAGDIYGKRSARRRGGSAFWNPRGTIRKARRKAPATLDLRHPWGIRAGRTHVLWHERAASGATGRCVCRQDTQGCQARRPGRRAADEVRSCDQHENGKGTRHHHSAITLAARGLSHRVRVICCLMPLGGQHRGN